MPLEIHVTRCLEISVIPLYSHTMQELFPNMNGEKKNKSNLTPHYYLSLHPSKSTSPTSRNNYSPPMVTWFGKRWPCAFELLSPTIMHYSFGWDKENQ